MSIRLMTPEEFARDLVDTAFEACGGDKEMTVKVLNEFGRVLGRFPAEDDGAKAEEDKP